MERPINLENFYIIDGNSYIYRAFYAIRELRTSTGFPTNAIYGFTSMLLKLKREKNVEYAACVFDSPYPGFRHSIFPEYKKNRAEMEGDLREQIPAIKEITSLLGFSLFEFDGCEADDIIASLARKFETRLSVYIITRDKDFLQMVGSNIKVMREENATFYDVAKVVENYGVLPEKLPDVMALCGDASDNIPGVPGFGEKTASRLIREYGSLEELISKQETIKNRNLSENLKNYSGRARLNKKLIFLDGNTPLGETDSELSLESVRLKEPDRDKLKNIFRRLEFKKLLASM